MRNWAGNYEFKARRLHRPRSVAEVQDVVRSAGQVRALGSRHSFNDIADNGGALISLEALPRVIDVDPVARTVTVDGGIRYGDLCWSLHAAGFALHNLASLPHISVAGACATGTHGSGVAKGSLSTAVVAMDMVRADGELISLTRAANPDAFPGAVVALGALGVVVRLTLAVEPSFRMRQDVFEDLPLQDFEHHFDEIAAMAESVSFFTEWRGDVVDQVWLKSRVEDGQVAEERPALYGAPAATRELHPIRHMSAAACTPQLGVAGPWHERLPHFRMEFTPSSGEELQSEYFIPRNHALAAFRALDGLRHRIAPIIQVSEIRTIAEDDLWLSPAYGRPSVAFHFTWKPEPAPVVELLPAIEAALAPFAPRPHWAKLFSMAPEELGSRYERLPDFVAVARQSDPEGTFHNAFLGRYVFPAVRRAAPR
jgi:xylitol oxidase